MRCRFYCCCCGYYTTARVNAAQIFAVGVRVALPFLLLLVLFHYGEGKRCSNFRRWSTRGVAVFTAVGAAITLQRRHMLQKFSPFGIRVALPFLLLLVLLLHYGEGKRCSNFRRWCTRCVAVFAAVGVAITLRRGQTLQKNFRRWCRHCVAVLLLLMLLLHCGEGKCCSNFRRWCRRYDAVFTAVGAAITLRRG